VLAQRLPEMRFDDLHEAPAHLRIAGDGPGPEQGLTLPGQGPAVVVGAVAVEAARQRALLPLGPQTQIDGVDPGRGRTAAEKGEQGLARLFGGREVGGSGAVVGEEHVEVAGVPRPDCARTGRRGRPRPAPGPTWWPVPRAHRGRRARRGCARTPRRTGGWCRGGRTAVGPLRVTPGTWSRARSPAVRPRTAA